MSQGYDALVGIWESLGFLSFQQAASSCSSEKRTDYAPTPEWRFLAAGIQPILQSVSFVYKSLEKRELVLSQQKAELDRLVQTVADQAMVRSVSEDESFEDMRFSDYYVSSSASWWVLLSDIKVHISDIGSWTKFDFESLDVAELRGVLVEVAKYCVSLIEGVAVVKAERDENNDAAKSDAPPVMPGQLALLRTSVFNTTILDVYRDQLKEHWADEDIDKIEEDHKALVRALKEEPAFKSRLDKHCMKTMFSKAWDDCGGRFKSLRSFASGLATAFPNTTSVEGDFSILNWEHNDNRTDLSNLSIAGIFQSKQREVLSNI